MNKKKIFVSEIDIGHSVDEVFVVNTANVKPYTGGRFLSCRLADRTGKINAVDWNPPEDAERLFRTGVLVRVKGKVGRYQNALQINVISISTVLDQESYDPVDFLPESPVDVQKVTAELKEPAHDLRNPFLESLWEGFFADEETFTAFCKSPAGKTWHHAYLGGLLEHTCNVVKICRFLSDFYPDVDRGLLLSGALFHDFGKVMELSTGFTLDYTDEGRLIGHVFLGAEKVRGYIRQIPDFPEETMKLLTHLILSHHGEEEGAIKPPMNREAMLLHFADNMDAQYNAFTREFEKTEDPDNPWTGYVNLINRYLYRGTQGKTDVEEEVPFHSG